VNLQALIDRYYNPAYARIWADHEAGRISTDQAIDRTHIAWERMAKKVERETGYNVSHEAR